MFTNVAKRWTLNTLATAAVVVAGWTIGAANKPAYALACENDACSRVCGMGVCTGDCFDSPGSQKNCDQVGGDCAVTNCNVE